MSLYSTQRLHELRMIVTGGGTGGHTYPALTTITTMRDRLAPTGAAPDLLWVGVADGLEATIATRNNIPFRAITTGKLRRSPNPRELARNITDAFRIPLGIAQAALTVARTRPAVVLSTGGFVSVPIGLAAAVFRVPYLLHEQTLTLGLANRILARVATRILLSHEASLQHLPPRARRRAVVTGNPIRPAMLHGDPDKGLTAYGLDPAVPLVLVTGGASGAQQINRMLTGALPGLLPHCQIVHQCGSLSHADMQQVARDLPAHLAHRYHVVDFIHDELPDLLAAATIVVARSGAGTVAELTALGKQPSLSPTPSPQATSNASPPVTSPGTVQQSSSTATTRHPATSVPPSPNFSPTRPVASPCPPKRQVTAGPTPPTTSSQKSSLLRPSAVVTHSQHW